MALLEEGFSFRPTDYERLCFLLRFMAKQDRFHDGFITTEVDVYGKDEPWEIYSKGVPTGQGEDDCSSYRYFLTKLKKKSKTRYHRDVGKTNGSWKQQDRGKPVRKADGGAVIGYKKSLTYENKNVDPEVYGHWLMKEYELSHLVMDRAIKFNDRRDWVLCAIKMKKPKSTTSPDYSVATKKMDFEAPINIAENLDSANHENLNMETRVQISTVDHSVMDQLSFMEELLMSDDVENLDCSQMGITTGEGAKDPMSKLDEFLTTLVQGADYSSMPNNNIATVTDHVEAASYQQQLETGDTSSSFFMEELLMSDTYESSGIMGYHYTPNQIIEQQIPNSGAGALTTQSNPQEEGAEYYSFEPIAVQHEGQTPSLVQANTHQQLLEDWTFDACQPSSYFLPQLHQQQQTIMI